MKKWVEYIRKKAGDSYQWKGGSKYGDWLFYHPPVNSHTAADGYTEPDFIATAYFAYSASLLAQTAKESETGHTCKVGHARFMREKVAPAIERVRELVDALEGLVDDEAWPLPTYQELLFIR